MTIAKNVRDGTMGIRQVGTPSADSTGFLTQSAIDYSGHLIRGLILSITPFSWPFNEDGSPNAPSVGLLVTYLEIIDGVPTIQRVGVASVSHTASGLAGGGGGIQVVENIVTTIVG